MITPAMIRAALLSTAMFSVCRLLIAAEPTGLKSESFDRDPGWEGNKNQTMPTVLPTVTQDFGYSTTQLAGKAPGEIGGRVQRAGEAAWYGAKISPKTLEDKLSASGTFAMTQSSGSSGLFFGWFNGDQPDGSGRPRTSLGLNFDGEPTGGRLAVFVITAQNQVTGKFITRYEKYRTPEERKIQRPTPIKNDGTKYHWKLDYDPAANSGNGQFQFVIKGESTPAEEFEGKTFTVDLPAGFKKQGTSFDHFGIVNHTKGGGPMTIHFSDLVADGKALDMAKDPGWEGSRNRATYQSKEVAGANDFGYQPTSHAGGATGELGGVIWRGPYSYYADRLGPLSLNDRLEARGRMYFEGAGVDSGMRIGWFDGQTKEKDDKNPNATGNFIGVDIGGHTRVGHWFLPACITAKGQRTFRDQGPLLKAGTSYEWSFIYDPAANGGKGQMRVTLGGESVTLDLPAGAKAQGAVLDRFGLTSVGTGGGQVKLYLDDLKYTATKP